MKFPWSLGFLCLVAFVACGGSQSVKIDALKTDGVADAGIVSDGEIGEDASSTDAGLQATDTFDLPRIDAPLPQDAPWFIPEASNRCRLIITALAPSNLLDLTPGPSQTLQVRGDIFLGNQPPFDPIWKWQVIRSDGVSFIPTQVGTDPDVVQIPISIPARYDITVSIGEGCTGTTHALAPSPQSRHALYHIRVLPPSALASENTELPEGTTCEGMVGGKCPIPYETDIRIEAGSTQITRDVALEIGTPVAIDPFDPSALPLAMAVPSYIRIQSPLSTWIIHGHSSTRGPLYTLLDAFIDYQVLIVPDVDTLGRALPPYLILHNNSNNTQVTAAYLASMANPLSLEQGITIRGLITANHIPVEGVQVHLQSDVLFSTDGVTNKQGAYTLRVNPSGVFAVSISPPKSSPLPTATIAQGIVLTDTATIVPPIDFNWTTGTTTDLQLTLEWSKGPTVLPPITVYLESDPESLPNVGTLTVTGVFPATLSGKIRRSAVTDASAQVLFTQLPLAKYKITVVPPSTLTDAAITTFTSDLTQPSERTNLTLPIENKAWASGRLLTLPPQTGEKAMGTLIYATDVGSGFFSPTVTTTLSDSGEFALLVDPGRTYRLRARPRVGQGFPEQVLLIGFTAGQTETQLEDQILPKGVEVQGTVTFASATIPGAIVQVFCMGQLPDCVDSADRSKGSPPVLAEAVTDTQGNYRLWLADPGITR